MCSDPNAIRIQAEVAERLAQTQAPTQIFNVHRMSGHGVAGESRNMEYFTVVMSEPRCRPRPDYIPVLESSASQSAGIRHRTSQQAARPGGWEAGESVRVRGSRTCSWCRCHCAWRSEIHATDGFS